MSADRVGEERILVWSGLRVGVAERPEFMAGTLAPALDAEVSAGRIRGWSLWGYGLPSRGHPYFAYNVVIGLPLDGPTPAGRLGLGPDRFPGQSLEDAAVREATDRVLAGFRKRYGDSLPLSIAHERSGTRLFLRQLAADPLSTPNATLLETVLATLFVFARAFGRGAGMADEVASMAKLWFRSQNATTEGFDEQFAARAELARGMARVPAIESALDSLRSGDYGRSAAALAEFEPACAATARSFSGLADRLPAEFPAPLAIWNNFVHPHLLRVGIDNDLEIALLLLVAMRLSETEAA